MHKNILIISDNIHLCSEFEKIISIEKYYIFNWSFAVSPFSDVNEFRTILKNKVLVFDLKKVEDLKKIISSYDLIISLHCKQIFPSELVNSIKCINVHPGYNPLNRGWYPQVFSIINDIPIGATIHEIDEELDNGNIIDRDFVQKELYDTSLTLYNKIIDLEIRLLKENLFAILQNDYQIIVPESKGNLYLKKDFNALCELNLNEKLTMIEAINKLRALTHGSYKNAYFVDSLTKKKIFVSIEFQIEK